MPYLPRSFSRIFFTDLFHVEQDVLKHGAYLVIFNMLIPTLAHDARLRITPNWALRQGKISYGVYMYHIIVINAVIFVGEKMHVRGMDGIGPGLSLEPSLWLIFPTNTTRNIS
jgi:peptidoglycan/LPS O-acetylase OafA/YrhL